MYKLMRMDGRTDGQRDDSVMPIADRTEYIG